MSTSFNVLLNSVGTAFLGGAVVELAAKNFLVAIGLALVGVVVFIVYEKAPPSKTL